MTTKGPALPPKMPLAAESEVVINIVWVGRSFDLFRPFTESMLRHTGARFRFVGNNCPPEELAVMEAFAQEHPGRIVEVLDVEPGPMVAHGLALDRVVEQRDDGDLFAFIDPDIYAAGPWLDTFLSLMTEHDAVTSGEELWSDSNVEPVDHVGIGVGGRHFYSPDGFVYGSPHLGLYRRSTVLAARERWQVGFSAAGPELSDAALEAIDDLGLAHKVFDTGKIFNILLQAQGGSLTHAEHPNLLHIGGLSHFVSPASTVEGPDGEQVPHWVVNPGVEARAQVAAYTASVLEARKTGAPPPDLPSNTLPHLRDRLLRVRRTFSVGEDPDPAANTTSVPWEEVSGLQEAFEDLVDRNDFTTIDHTLQITTAGGCATTALVDYFTERGVDLQKGPGQWPFKHARLAPRLDEVPEGFKVLYVVGDPRDAVLSLFRRGYQFGHARAMGHDWRETRRRQQAGLSAVDRSVPSLGPASTVRLRDLDTYLAAGVDEFDFAGHLDAWRNHPPGYPVMFVRYDHLGARWDDVRDFVGIPETAPRFEVRPRDSRWDDLPRHQKAILHRMYGDLVEEIASLPPVEVV